jgi:hypothetical protein
MMPRQTRIQDVERVTDRNCHTNHTLPEEALQMNQSSNAAQCSTPNASTDTTRCVMYIRTGVPGLIDNYLSMAQQRERLETYASDKGWTICKVYEDEGSSGVTVERPALKQLMADAERHCFARVVVLQVETLSPRADDLAALINRLHGLSIGVVSATQSLDTLDPMQWLMFTTLIQIVRSENELAAGHQPRQTSSTASQPGNATARFAREVLTDFIRFEKEQDAERRSRPKPSPYRLDAERRLLS